MTKSKHTGRIPKVTRKITKQFCAAVQVGATYKEAAGLIGITERTVYHWQRKGKEAAELESPDKKDLLYIHFFQELQKAEAAAVISRLRVINTDPSWQAAAWYLERRYPERWALRSRIDQVAERRTGEVINYLLGGLNEDARSQALALLGAIGSLPENDEPTPENGIA